LLLLLLYLLLTVVVVVVVVVGDGSGGGVGVSCAVVCSPGHGELGGSKEIRVSPRNAAVRATFARWSREETDRWRGGGRGEYVSLVGTV